SVRQMPGRPSLSGSGQSKRNIGSPSCCSARKMTRREIPKELAFRCGDLMWEQAVPSKVRQAEYVMNGEERSLSWNQMAHTNGTGSPVRYGLRMQPSSLEWVSC